MASNKNLTDKELKERGQEEFRTGAGDADRREDARKAMLEDERAAKPGEYHARYATDLFDSNLQALELVLSQVKGKMKADGAKKNGDEKKATIKIRNVASTNWNRGDTEGQYGATFANYRRMNFNLNIKYLPKEVLDDVNGKLSAAGATEEELFNPNSEVPEIANRKIIVPLTLGINTPLQVELGAEGYARPDSKSPPVTGFFEADSASGRKHPRLTKEAADEWIASEPNLVLNSFGPEKRQIEELQEGAGKMPIATLLQHSDERIVTKAKENARKQYLDVVAGYGDVQDFGDTGQRGVAAGGLMYFNCKKLAESLEKTIGFSKTNSPKAPSSNVGRKDGKPSPDTKRGNVTVDAGYVPGHAITHTRPISTGKDMSRKDPGIGLGD